MKTLLRFTSQWLAMAALMLTASCKFAYFESPVPQGVPDMKTIPAFLDGEYEASGSEAFGNEQGLRRTLFKFEKLSETQLLVSMESALPAGDLPKMEKALAGAMEEGRIQDYYVSDRVVYYLPAPNDEGETPGVAVYLEKRGNWIRSPQWLHLTYIFDLSNGKMIVFDYGNLLEANDVLLAPAKTESSKNPLTAKARGDEVWLSAEEAPGKWGLFYLKRLSDKELAIKGTLFFDEEHFGNHRAKFEAVTPFRRDDDNDFILNPGDEQLAKLLADPKLFGNVMLKKLK
jgi:hypothetical protein